MKTQRLFLLILIAVMCLPLLAACNEKTPAPLPEETGASGAVTTEPETQAAAAATTAVATTEPAETEVKEEKKEMQIIADLTFEDGIQLISQKDHANGDVFSVLDEHDFYGGEANDPVWRLAQWDSGPCFVENRIESEPTVITDGMGRSFGYDPEHNVMTFELDTSLYYHGRPAVEGDYWPHFLVEQDNFAQSLESSKDMDFLICDADRLVLSMDIRLLEFLETPIDGDWTRAAQFLMYFYVKGTDSHDFCWFGVQLFDNRADRTNHYIGYDGGKADSSGAMIYSIGSKHVYRNSGRTLYKDRAPDLSGEWVHVEIDLKPFLEDMLKKGLDDGYFTVDSLSDLYIGGMNVGWETIGTFYHTMEIRDLQLVSYMDEVDE